MWCDFIEVSHFCYICAFLYTFLCAIFSIKKVFSNVFAKFKNWFSKFNYHRSYFNLTLVHSMNFIFSKMCPISVEWPWCEDVNNVPACLSSDWELPGGAGEVGESPKDVLGRAVVAEPVGAGGLGGGHVPLHSHLAVAQHSARPLPWEPGTPGKVLHTN